MGPVPFLSAWGPLQELVNVQALHGVLTQNFCRAVWGQGQL